MSTKTNFYLYFDSQDNCQIKIKHVKFKEHEFSLVQGLNEICLESFTSWTLPCRLIVTNLSDKPITLYDLRYSISTYANLKLPVIVHFENNLIPYKQITISPYSQESIKFYCKIVNINKVRS